MALGGRGYYFVVLAGGRVYGGSVSQGGDMRCLLCNADKAELSPAYRPDGTLRDITVYLCKRCGFLFSQGQPHGDGVARPTPDAAFGNLRQGKADRVEPHLDFL